MFDFANAEQIADPDAARSCLSNDEVLDLASGRATSERLAGMRAHVDRCADCQRLVSVAKESASSGPHELHWGATFREGDVVARRYRIHRFIARGGMGEVYDAFDRDLHERVALKTVLSTSNESFCAARQLRAEVQLAHRVSHPNVCRIYDLGTHVLPNGCPLNFLTMEFIDGESLRARIERGPLLSLDESVAIARQLLLGLAAAHAAGILHRDFKSENVMLRATKDAGPSAVIMDFGLASPMDTTAALMTHGANSLVGTPCYMSPEQLEGAQLSAASDVYSFGVVWFEMITGTLPFSVRTPFDRLRRQAPRPSRARPDISAALDAIIARCLARNRSDRFSSAEEVLDALDEAMPSRVSQIAPRRRRRRPLGLVAAVAVMSTPVVWVALKSHAASHATAAVSHSAPGNRPAPIAAPTAPSGTQDGPAGGASASADPGYADVAPAPGVLSDAPGESSLRAPVATDARRDRRRRAPQEHAATRKISLTTRLEPDPSPQNREASEATSDFADAPTPATTPHDDEPARAPGWNATKRVMEIGAPPASSRAPREHGFLNPFRRTEKL